MVKNLPVMQETPVRFLGQEDRLPTAVFMGFPGGSDGNESACSAGDPCLIPRLGRSPGEGHSCPLQDSGLENSMDCTVHCVTKSWTQLSNVQFHSEKLFVEEVQLRTELISSDIKS